MNCVSREVTWGQEGASIAKTPGLAHQTEGRASADALRQGWPGEQRNRRAAGITAKSRGGDAQGLLMDGLAGCGKEVGLILIRMRGRLRD